jgi:uncharacterized protein YdeI (YjbR/CyaY-like superfamily)
MTSGSESRLDLRHCVNALLQEIERAESAAVRLDLKIVEDCALQHMRLTEELRQALVAHPAAEEMMAPLRTALRRYALVLRGSERLVQTIARVLNTGSVTAEV